MRKKRHNYTRKRRFPSSDVTLSTGMREVTPTPFTSQLVIVNCVGLTPWKSRGEVDFEMSPELLEQFPYTIRSAVCFWNLHKLYCLADHGPDPRNVDEITAVINKLTNSYENRRRNFAQAYSVFKSLRYPYSFF
jgi:hypothetical protein